jgi:heme-degrading monooxygenase HmoA
MGAVILINPFEVPPGRDDDFLGGWQRAADHLSQQPGFIIARLHRALSPEARFRFINVAEWESAPHFQAAVGNEEFRRMTAGAAPGYPALFEVIRTCES